MRQRAIDSRRFSHEEDAVQEALSLWEERERRRLEILGSLDEAEVSLAGGEGRRLHRAITRRSTTFWTHVQPPRMPAF